MPRALTVAGMLALAAAFGEIRPASPQELPTPWEVPPGDRLEHETAGFAKILCSAIFITGRELATAAEEDGFFVAPRDMRSKVVDTVVDRDARAVHLTLPNGVTRSARLVGDQGCVTLPRGANSVFFTPVRVTSSLPDATTLPWPMGDRLPDGPLPPEVDRAQLEAAVTAAFAPAEALTAAFVVVHKGRLIAERYQDGLDHTTRLPSWSMGKSITATLMGQLIQEGVYELWAQAPVAEWQGADDPRRAIRIADLLRMSSGLRFVAPQDPDYDPSRGYADHLYVYTGAIDAFRWSITRPPQWPPNTVGHYRNSDPLTLNYLIKQAALAQGEEYLGYPQRHLFDKLGIRRMVLETDPYGNFLLNGYELGTGRDWARLGLLYLQDGVW
ncbi:MAG: serine hydrolase domain-containing protein, partial [Dongiaceae bacterium]